MAKRYWWSTVGELRALMQDLPPDTPVLTPAPDHAYRRTTAQVTTALKEGSGADDWTEDYGEEMTPESEFGKRTRVVVIE